MTNHNIFSLLVVGILAYPFVFAYSIKYVNWFLFQRPHCEELDSSPFETFRGLLGGLLIAVFNWIFVWILVVVILVGGAFLLYWIPRIGELWAKLPTT